jgi:hypothetical protein
MHRAGFEFGFLGIAMAGRVPGDFVLQGLFREIQSPQIRAFFRHERDLASRRQANMGVCFHKRNLSVPVVSWQGTIKSMLG